MSIPDRLLPLAEKYSLHHGLIHHLVGRCGVSSLRDLAALADGVNGDDSEIVNGAVDVPERDRPIQLARLRIAISDTLADLRAHHYGHAHEDRPPRPGPYSRLLEVTDPAPRQSHPSEAASAVGNIDVDTNSENMLKALRWIGLGSPSVRSHAPANTAWISCGQTYARMSRNRHPGPHPYDLIFDVCCIVSDDQERWYIDHNILDLKDTEATCHHVHCGRGMTTPTASDVPIEICFTVAMGIAADLKRKGTYNFNIPRRLPITRHGIRRGVANPPFRRLSMDSLFGISLGLDGPHGEWPKVRSTFELRDADGSLMMPEDAIYVGYGNHDHRLPTTEWMAPGPPSFDRSTEESLWQSALLIYSGRLPPLTVLKGKTIVCDCQHGGACHADVLRMAAIECLEGVVRQKPISKSWRAAALMYASGCQPDETYPGDLRSEDVARAFQSLYPPEFFRNFKFPNIQCVLDSGALDEYRKWRSRSGLPESSEGGPTLSRQRHRDVQSKVHSAKGAMPAVVSYGLEPSAHYAAAIDAIKDHDMSSLFCDEEDDLAFAADEMTWRRHGLRSRRNKTIGALSLLANLWRKVTARLRSLQPPSVRIVTKDRDVGLVGLLCVLFSWPDTDFPLDLIRGFRCLGVIKNCGVYPVKLFKEEHDIDLGENSITSNLDIIARCVPGEHSEFIEESCDKDYQLGFAEKPISLAEWRDTYRAGESRLIRRFAVVQAGGKIRACDDGDQGGHSDATRDHNTLRLCSALRPAEHAKMLHTRIRQMGDSSDPRRIRMEGDAARQAVSTQDWTLETGGEDWPSAYRFVPIFPDHIPFCMVTYWSVKQGRVLIQKYNGMLFGLSGAVVAFNRWPRLAEALTRRLLGIMFSMYFDDATIQDWQSEKGSGQAMVQRMMAILGSPFAPSKTQFMAIHGVFLGLSHHLESWITGGFVRIWIKQTLLDKVALIIQQCRDSKSCGSGVAAKLFGCLNFLDTATYGHILRGGLGALKECISGSDSPSLPEKIERTFVQIEAILSRRPERLILMNNMVKSPFVAASDAALEGGIGTGGFLIDVLGHSKTGAYMTMGREVFDMWQPGDRKIAQLELLMVLDTFLSAAHVMRGRRGVFFIDNIAALMSLVRGSSRNEDLDAMASMIRGLCMELDISVYFEWIQSKSNWSDGISRDGLKDKWYQSKGFRVSESRCIPLLWRIPFITQLRVFSFL